MNKLKTFSKLSFFLGAAVIFAVVTLHPQLAKAQSDADPLLKDVTGQELQQIINSYEGKKAVLVNVWATWCAPCIEEFPHIVELQRAYEDELKVIFVSADFSESRDKAKKFLEKQSVDWTTYFKTGKDQPFIEALSDKWSGALPFTKILKKDGSVLTSWEQGADYEKFERNIKNAIQN